MSIQDHLKSLFTLSHRAVIALEQIAEAQSLTAETGARLLKVQEGRRELEREFVACEQKASAGVKKP